MRAVRAHLLYGKVARTGWDFARSKRCELLCRGDRPVEILEAQADIRIGHTRALPRDELRRRVAGPSKNLPVVVNRRGSVT